ncbi:MAG TPA: BON domain-containing protein [Terriglobales bacterium]|nr:BON domain-containing protein [Terriglobales bacterium]
MNARRSCYVVTVAAVLALGVLAGCSRARNDAQIAGEVQGKINADSNIPTKQITVTSSNGIVTLAGTVSNDMERQAAANDAAQVEGVKTVVNNLQVTPATAQAAPEPEPQPEPEPSRASVRTRRTSPRVYSNRSVSAPSSTPARAPATYSSAPASTAMVPPAPPKPVTIADGTVLQVRMIDTIDSGVNQPGDRFHATLDTPVTIDDKVIVPQGADIEGRVAELKSAGHFAGKPEIALELTSLSINGRRYSLHTNQYSREGSSRGRNTAAKVGTGAAVGSIIGAIAGGGKGAAIGGIIGAGAGGGVQAASKAPSIHVPSEALLSFTLQSPLTVTPASEVQRSRSNRIAEYNDSSQEPPQSDGDSNAPVLKRRR